MAIGRPLRAVVEAALKSVAAALGVVLALAGCRVAADRHPALGGLGQLRLFEANALAGMVIQRAERPIGTGGSLSTAVAAASGLSTGAVDPWVQALGMVVDARSLKPSDRVRVELSGRGLHRVELWKSPIERYEALPGADGTPAAKKLAFAPEQRLRRVSGTVTKSLSEAVVTAGGSGDLVSQVGDLFAYQIDLLTDPRPGDYFDILVEEQWIDGEPGGQQILMARYDGARVRAAAYRYTDRKGIRDYYSADGTSLRTSFLRSPLNYRRVTSHFTSRRLHPIFKTYRPHFGVDFAAPRGTPIVAVGDGTVDFAGYRGGNGNLVILRHPGGMESYYLHLEHIAQVVRRGAKVSQGQVLGRVGGTGHSTGPHLCFRIRRNGRFVDPLRLDLPPGPPVPPAEREAFLAERRKWDALTAVLANGSAVPARDLGRLATHSGQVAQATAVARYATTGARSIGRMGDPGPAGGETRSASPARHEARGTL